MISFAIITNARWQVLVQKARSHQGSFLMEIGNTLTMDKSHNLHEYYILIIPDGLASNFTW